MDSRLSELVADYMAAAPAGSKFSGEDLQEFASVHNRDYGFQSLGELKKTIRDAWATKELKWGGPNLYALPVVNADEEPQTLLVTHVISAAFGFVLAIIFMVLAIVFFDILALRYVFLVFSLGIGLGQFQAGLSRFYSRTYRSPLRAKAAWVVLAATLATLVFVVGGHFSDSPTRLADKWLEAMQRDDLGAQMEMWGDVDNITWIIDPWSWSLLSKEIEENHAILRYRVKSSTEGGIPIEKQWTVSMTYDDDAGKWLITSVN